MMVGRGDVNRARLGVVPLLREDHRHLCPAPQHVGDDRLMPGVQVLDHHHRNRESGRQAAEHVPQGDDAACRCCDSDDAIRLAWFGPGRFPVDHRSTMPGRYAHTFTSVAVHRWLNEVLSERAPAAPLLASAADAVVGALTQSRHRPVRRVPGFARGGLWIISPFRAMLWLRLTHQPEAYACPAGVIYPPETPRLARTWPPAGVRLEGKVSPPAKLPGGRGPRCVAPAQRGPLSRPFWVPPLGAIASFSLVARGGTA